MVAWTHDLLWRIEIGCARIFLSDNSEYTYVAREKAGDEVASGPTDAGATDMPGILAAADALTTRADLSENTCWINPDDLPNPAGQPLDSTANQLNTVSGTLGDAPSRAQLIDGTWIEDIK